MNDVVAIISGLVFIPLMAWMLKKIYDISVLLARLQERQNSIEDRMSGIRSFSETLTRMDVAIADIYRIVDRRMDNKPVKNDRRKSS